jgi:hypothetical protein
MNRYSLVFAILFLCFIASLPVYAQPETTIGPVTGPVPPADIEAWMLSGDYHFHREGWWLGGYSNTMMVKSGDTDVFVKDLTEQQKTYIWERMTPEQRRQMGDEYGKIGFGMGGHLQQRPAEWGQLLNARIAEYFRGVSGWAEVAKQRHEAKIPQEAKDFAIDKDNFLQNNKDKLTQEQIVRIQKGADAVAKLADIIATIELKRIEIAVKGLSGGLIGIITDYCTGFVTHGANYVSDAIATVLGKMIDIGRNAAGKSLSPGDQIALLNQQLALANGTLNDEIAKERVMWAQILAGQEPQEPPPPDQANVAVSILFLVDCSGSMRGAKIESAKQAVVNSVNQTNDGKTEWALLGFGGACTCWQVVPFTTDASQLQAAVASLVADGGTPLTYSIYKATTYLVKNGHAAKGRLIVLCDGENNCGQRQGGGRTEAAAGLRSIISTHNLSTGG